MSMKKERLKKVKKMALRDKAIPNEISYKKLKDFANGERIPIKDCGINETSRFGAQPYLVAMTGEQISLPTRYKSYIEEIREDVDLYNELRSGVTIVKSSRICYNGTETPTFEII